ncbi:uncharacterized protein zbbx isoform X2 [Denticeps clupeoides]|uniref:uncharacterized protein zbbx isoform X2 n=1 Tax=Denticeps clupeoides TaxID=299321 RepID=UPI0010A57022|nr:zinc finger B-box domain-containing protein 1 isoform X2 [Denticeps clupeoides]
MDLNKFVFIPSKPKSLKLNGRNLRELRMETVQLAEENMEMEGRLKQLREDMGRQKEERARYGGLWWKSGQAGALTSPPQNGKRNGTGKLSGGKVKIRVLKDEPPGVRSPARGHGAETQKPVDSGPGPQAGDQSSNRTPRPRLKGKVCGQCEAKTAGLVCAECGEDYCIGCFTKFHQKGALKLHRMIPVQMEIQTSVSTLDVVRHFQSQPGLEMSTRPQTRGLQTGQASWTGGLDKGHHMAQTKRHDTQPRSDRCSELPQVLVVNHEEEAAAAAGGEEAGEEEFENLPVGWGHSTVAPLLRGCFDEEESAQSFQQALQEWRGTVREHRQQPVSVEALGIQADFDQNKPLPTRIEFRQHSLSYMEKLLIKKHRRTPVEGYRPLSSSSSTQAQDPLSLSNTEADEKFCLTAEEQELHRYCVSLFAVPVHKASDELGYPSESSFCIADLGKTAGDMGSTATAGATEEENKKLNEDKENHHDTKTRRSISAHSLCLPLGIKEGSASLDASSSFPSDQHTPTRSQTAGRNLVPSTRATSLTLQPLRLGFSSVGSVQSPSPPPQSQKPTLSPRLTAAIGFKTLKAKAVAPLAPELSSAARLKGSPVLFPPSGFTPAPPEHQSSNSIQAPRLPMPSSPRPIQTSSSSNYQSNKLRNQHHISNPLGHLNRRRPSRPESADSPNSVQPQAPSLTELFQSFNCNISRSEVTPSSTSSSDMLMSAMGIDSEGEGLSDSISPLPNQGNSSDEEMRGSPVSSTGPSGLDISAEEVRNPRSSSCSDLKPLDTGLFTQPSPKGLVQHANALSLNKGCFNQSCPRGACRACERLSLEHREPPKQTS